MALISGNVASTVLIWVGSTRIQSPRVKSTWAPMRERMCFRVCTSWMAGRFSRIQHSPARIAAGMMATAAFFAPLMVTVPSSRRPPWML